MNLNQLSVFFDAYLTLAKAGLPLSKEEISDHIRGIVPAEHGRIHDVDYDCVYMSLSPAGVALMTSAVEGEHDLVSCLKITSATFTRGSYVLGDMHEAPFERAYTVFKRTRVVQSKV